MRIAVLPFDVRLDAVDDNVALVEAGLRAAAREGVALVVLPEMWPTSFPVAETDVDAATMANARAVEHVRACTRELDLVVAGSALHARERARPTNRWHLIERGEIVASHDKIHLFTPTAEDASFSAGDAPPSWADTRAGRVGGTVCYDLRFPEPSRWLFHAGVEVLAVSAQWPTARLDHLEALSAGRAVETQSFVAVCNRTGTAFVGRRRLELAFPGRGSILDPHGRVLARGGAEAGLVTADVDLDVVRELRVRVPVTKDERRDVYARWRETR